MYRSAELTSLLYPLQELQDRISLEVPATFLKDERIQESTDQNLARYSIAYYLTADNEPEGDEADIQSIVERLAENVLNDKEVLWDIKHGGSDRGVYETTVSVTWPEGTQPREASAAEPYDALPLTTYADQNVYNIATDGNTFFILKNGKAVVEDAPSPAYALGALIPLLREELLDIETTSGLQNSPPNDFLAGLAMSVIDTPDIDDEAKEHFVKFYELVTLTDFEAQGGDEEPENG